MKNNLVNFKQMLNKAYKNKYAIAQININNLEWTKAALLAANESNSSIILGVSKGAKNYMGSYKLVYNLVNDLIDVLDIKVNVCLHLDHGTYEECLEAIEANFSSIMFDGSKLEFKENLEKTKELIKLCESKNISLETEVGSIGGYEDGISSSGEIADINECEQMLELNINALAACFGNIHGIYPQDWKGLDFELLKNISNLSNKPLVLHGGSGIKDSDIQKSIQLGISKININTECQIEFTKTIIEYFKENNNINDKKTYDPRNYFKLGIESIKELIKKKIKLFRSYNKN